MFKAYDKLMRHLHTLNVHHVHVHDMHYASHRSKTNLYDKSGHYNRIIANYGFNPNRFWSHLNRELVCSNLYKKPLPAQKHAGYQHYRLNTSEESRALKSYGFNPNRFWSHLVRGLAR